MLLFWGRPSAIIRQYVWAAPIWAFLIEMHLFVHVPGRRGHNVLGNCRVEHLLVLYATKLSRVDSATSQTHRAEGRCANSLVWAPGVSFLLSYVFGARNLTHESMNKLEGGAVLHTSP